jgi:hypothetical protein
VHGAGSPTTEPRGPGAKLDHLDQTQPAGPSPPPPPPQIFGSTRRFYMPADLPTHCIGHSAPPKRPVRRRVVTGQGWPF